MNRENMNAENVSFVNNNGVEYIQFKNIQRYKDLVSHCFTTRKGGVSKGECESLNMGFNRNDSRENVEENFRRIANCLNIKPENMVFSNQIHDCKIKVVDQNDRGKGIVRKTDLIGFDGIVTNIKGVALVTFYADCVPLFFIDPVKKVICLAHSGWRGTVKQIAAKAVKKMINVYDCCVNDIEVAIGPSIGNCCFEVGEEVFEEFHEHMEWSDRFCLPTRNDKWNIDLKGIIEQTLINSGVRKEKVFNSKICTKCNNDLFFSYRGSNGRTGSLAAIMQLL